MNTVKLGYIMDDLILKDRRVYLKYDDDTAVITLVYKDVCKTIYLDKSIVDKGSEYAIDFIYKKLHEGLTEDRLRSLQEIEIDNILTKNYNYMVCKEYGIDYKSGTLLLTDIEGEEWEFMLEDCRIVEVDKKNTLHLLDMENDYHIYIEKTGIIGVKIKVESGFEKQLKRFLNLSKIKEDAKIINKNLYINNLKIVNIEHIVGYDFDYEDKTLLLDYDDKTCLIRFGNTFKPTIIEYPDRDDSCEEVECEDCEKLGHVIDELKETIKEKDELIDKLEKEKKEILEVVEKVYKNMARNLGIRV